MTNPIRAAAERLLQQLDQRRTGLYVPLKLEVAEDELRAALAAPTPPADPDALAARPLLEAVAQMGGQHTMGRIMALSKRAASWLNENPPGQPVAIEPRGCPTPGACSCVQPVTPTPSLAELVNPQPGYQPGTGREDGAQLVGGEWWAPEFGCDSMDATLEAIRDRIAPYLREPVAGVDVPGPDGDYGGLVELCRAQGVDPELGVPLLQRARKAWGVGTATPEPDTDAVLGLAAILREVNSPHLLGAAAMAEAILSHPSAHAVLAAAPSDGPAVPEEGREPAAVEGEFSPTVLDAPTPPTDGDVEELIWRLGWIAAQCADIGWSDDSASVTRAAALLRQLPPEGLEALEYFHADSGAYIARASRKPDGHVVVYNCHHISPYTFFPTVAAAWEALQQSCRQEVGDD